MNVFWAQNTLGVALEARPWWLRIQDAGRVERALRLDTVHGVGCKV